MSTLARLFRMPPLLVAILALAVATEFVGAQATEPKLPPSAGATEANAIHVDYKEVELHRVGDPPEMVVVPGSLSRKWPWVQDLAYTITVSPDGAVTKIKGDFWGMRKKYSPTDLINRAEITLRALHYRPFLRNGAPVWATFEEQVWLYPPAKTPSTHVPFPDSAADSKDRQDLLITLRRTGCFGSCPSYRVQIRGDGIVDYDGENFVAVKGHHTATIPQESIDRLLDLFRQTDYFSLKGEYRYPVTDNPAYRTSISIGNHSKSVIDYVGRSAGMPAAVERLENAIDEAADSARWVVGNKKTASSLAAEHFDFKSSEAEDLLGAVAADDNTEAVRAFVAAGTPVRDPVMPGAELSPSTVSTGRFPLPLVSAALSGNLEMLRILLDAGADPNGLDGKTGSTPLISAQSPEIVRALLNAGADPNIQDMDHLSAIDYARKQHGGWKLEMLEKAHSGVIPK